jgi:4-amino-4-deoxy-L-arabinose transferase-like glycosyltransferase
VFASDECFHAYLAEWIGTHLAFPHELPGFYSGLPYFYPPLLHVIGALVFKLAGADALRHVNVILTGVLLLALRALPVPGVPAAARRCAALLAIATPALSLYAVRFYAETLATLLAVLVVALLLRVRTPGMRAATRDAVALGLVTGLALLAKQPAVLLPALLALLAALDLARGERPRARAMVWALAVALIVAAPYFARNALLFGSPFYPPVPTQAQQVLDVMNTRLFSLPPPWFYRNALIVIGPLVPWIALAALAWNALRGRFDLVTGLLAACVAFVFVGPLVPRFQPRHLNPVTGMMALLGSIALIRVLPRTRRAPALQTALQVALIAWAGFALTRLTGLRSGLDASPGDRAAYRAIANLVPAGETVLSRSTYDTFYYSRRNATWPIPWGNTAGQLALFGERDPARFLATLDRLGIHYLLVPRRATGPRFTGANHPESLIGCVAALVAGGRMTVLWGSSDLVLVARIR